MRLTLVVLALALAALPLASASGERVSTPDVKVWTTDQHVAPGSLDSTTGNMADLAVDAKGQTAEVKGVSCDLQFDTSTKAPTMCRAAAPSGPSASKVSDLVDAKVDLHLTPAAAKGSAPVSTASTNSADAPLALDGQTVALAAAAAGVSLAALYGIWRALKWTGIAAFVPLYSHLTDAQILDDANRGAIYKLIQTEPGISTKDIAERLHLAWGTVTHHLAKLEKRRFIVSKKYGKYRRYFANGSGGTEQKDQVAVLRLDRTGDIAALIQATPGVTQKAVSEALGVSSSTILWHVKRLEGAHLITKVRDGKLVRYYPGEGLGTVMVAPVAVTTTAA